MIKETIGLIWVLLAILTHEFGHYWIAKKQNIYNGWGILPTPHIKLKKPYANKLDYLSGIYGSFLVAPLFLFTAYTWYVFPIFTLGIAISDFIPIIWWKSITK